MHAGSLFQKTAAPFTPDHQVLFGAGLRASNIFYSHQDTVVWMQPELPEGLGDKLAAAGLARTYEDSGWCYVELTSSAIVKDKDRRLDLSHLVSLGACSCPCPAPIAHAPMPTPHTVARAHAPHSGRSEAGPRR